MRGDQMPDAGVQRGAARLQLAPDSGSAPGPADKQMKYYWFFAVRLRFSLDYLGWCTTASTGTFPS
jgi:hypothetical protein